MAYKQSILVIVLDIISNFQYIEIYNFRYIVSNVFCPPSPVIPAFFMQIDTERVRLDIVPKVSIIIMKK